MQGRFHSEKGRDIVCRRCRAVVHFIIQRCRRPFQRALRYDADVAALLLLFKIHLFLHFTLRVPPYRRAPIAFCAIEENTSVSVAYLRAMLRIMPIFSRFFFFFILL